MEQAQGRRSFYATLSAGIVPIHSYEILWPNVAFLLSLSFKPFL
jgi:hypothetical protein